MPTNLVNGKLDTLIDLNSDGKIEIILDNYKWQSAGATHEYILFADQGSGKYVKVASLATSLEGFSPISATEGSKYITSLIRYAASTTGAVIHVEETRTWTIDLENEKFGKETKKYSYTWDGNKLTRKVD